MAEYETVLYETEGSIARVTLNRPEKLNALSRRLQEELEAAVREANDDSDVSVVILKGAGREFSSGYDLTPAGTGNYTRNPGFKEFYVGDSAKPRLSIGVGVNWVSPFGPLRIDLAKALLKEDGDDTKLFSFNVGTAF